MVKLIVLLCGFLGTMSTSLYSCYSDYLKNSEPDSSCDSVIMATRRIRPRQITSQKSCSHNTESAESLAKFTREYPELIVDLSLNTNDDEENNQKIKNYLKNECRASKIAMQKILSRLHILNLASSPNTAVYITETATPQQKKALTFLYAITSDPKSSEPETYSRYSQPPKFWPFAESNSHAATDMIDASQKAEPGTEHKKS